MMGTFKNKPTIFALLCASALLLSCAPSASENSEKEGPIASEAEASWEPAEPLVQQEAAYAALEMPQSEEKDSYAFSGKFFYPRASLTRDFSVSLSFQDFATYDNAVYHPDLANLAMVLSNNIYDVMNMSIDGYERESDNNRMIFNVLGMEDYELIALKSSDYQIDANDTATFQLAHRSFRQDGVTHEAVFVVFEGTTDAAEWISDMDLGACEEYLALTGEHPDYKNTKRHKGIEVAFERALPRIESYLASHIEEGTPTSLLLTGHSRGAGLANIAGAYFEDQGKYRPYTYTFASPRVTSEENVARESIFNVLNAQDFVGALAPKAYGFSRYGKDLYFNPKDFESTFKKETGFDYAAMDVDALVGKFLTMAPSLSDLYTIKEDDDHTLGYAVCKGPFLSESSAQKRIDSVTSKYFKDYNPSFYASHIAKKWKLYFVQAYDCPAMALQGIAVIANESYDKLVAAEELGKALLIFSGSPQRNLITYFVYHGSALGTNHEMFTYFAGLDHLQQA